MKKFFLFILFTICIVCAISCVKNNTDIGPLFSTLPDDYVGKKVINLTSLNYDSELEIYVEAFNEKNIEYIINVRYYYDIAQDTQETWSTIINNALNKFNTDLMAGYVPDVILCNGSIPINSYIRKGMISDIYPLMDTDENFNKDNYLTNVFTAAEQNGKLYEVFPFFYIQTLYAKENDVEKFQQWTIDSLDELISSKLYLKHAIGNYTGSRFIEEMLTELIYEKGIIQDNIDRNELLKLLEISQVLPEEISLSYDELMMGLRYGDPIICDGMLFSPRDIRVWEKVYAGNDITFVGYPTSKRINNKVGIWGDSYFVPSMKFSIMAQAEEKEGAWEFIKFVLDYDAGGKIGKRIPVKLSLINELMSKAKEDYNDNEYSIRIFTQAKEIASSEILLQTNNNTDGYIDVIVGNNTDEDNAKFLDVLQSVNKVRMYDNAISNIISEEISNYYSGQYNINQLADSIENRVNLYISEMS